MSSRKNQDHCSGATGAGSGLPQVQSSVGVPVCGLPDLACENVELQPVCNAGQRAQPRICGAGRQVISLRIVFIARSCDGMRWREDSKAKYYIMHATKSRLLHLDFPAMLFTD